MREVISLEEKGFSGVLGEGIRKAIAKVQPGAPFAKATVRFPGKFRLSLCEWRNFDGELGEKQVEVAPALLAESGLDDNASVLSLTSDSQNDADLRVCGDEED